MSTPTALKVFLDVTAGVAPSMSIVLVNLYIVTKDVSIFTLHN